VTDVVNTAALPVGGAFGGQISHHYGYDDLYRLTSATGTFAGSGSKAAHYTLGMTYDNLSNITSKHQTVDQTGVQFDGTLNVGYNLSYQYAANSQQMSNIADSSYRYADAESPAPTLKAQNYSYDANGNLLYVNTGQKNPDGVLLKTNERKLLWDEENRLLALSDNGYVSNYWYDAAGERTVKTSGESLGAFINGKLSAAHTSTTKFTAYINPYMVLNNGGLYSKHIYIGSQRIMSKLGNSLDFANDPLITTPVEDLGTTKYATMTATLKSRYDSLGVPYSGTENGTAGMTASTPLGAGGKYYYHSDHLGSSSLVTDADGNVAQHIEYIPFGEVFVEEKNNSWSTPYKFNAKELDEETGLYYYGARYYDPKTSVWLSVDPLAEKYPNVDSYVYCHNNPVNMIDPDGRSDSPSLGIYKA